MAKPERALLEREVLRLMHGMGYGFPADLSVDAVWDDVWDSLDEIDFFLRVEQELDLTLAIPGVTNDQRLIQSRRPFHVKDFVDLIELQWGSGCRGKLSCLQCRYDLSGVPPGACPECGEPYRRLLASRSRLLQG